MRNHVVLLLLVTLVTLSRAQFRCPELKGFFPDPEQCDLYYACIDGQPEERLCKDGLVFRDDNPKKEFCDIPANVPCNDRNLLREFQIVKIIKKRLSFSKKNINFNILTCKNESLVSRMIWYF